MKKTMTILFYALLLIGLTAFLILQLPVFGKNPTSARLERIKKSKNWNGKEFKNLSETPQITGDATMTSLVWDMLFGKKNPRLKPIDQIPNVKTDLKNLEDNTLVWFGHSSYIFKLNSKIFLVDPVLSGSASPIPGSLTAFPGSNEYTLEDFPAIDYLIISHDHYDHLDYKSIKGLSSKINHIICGLGVGSHFEHWGFKTSDITELDWYEKATFNGFTITSTPARHFSGRALKRNQTLWSSYVLTAPDFNLFIGGDSGYDTHLKKIGETYGPFDLAILENGQYNVHWKHIHSLPEEMPQIIKDLRVKTVLPVHSGKFVLANHSWDEPLELISNHTETRIITPMIGQPVHFKDSTQTFTKWWQSIK